LYVADSANNRIQVFDTNGKFIRTWGTLVQAMDNSIIH
jgi:DNA-binding beta-propeller fold protein YncE